MNKQINRNADINVVTMVYIFKKIKKSLVYSRCSRIFISFLAENLKKNIYKNEKVEKIIFIQRVNHFQVFFLFDQALRTQHCYKAHSTNLHVKHR